MVVMNTLVMSLPVLTEDTIYIYMLFTNSKNKIKGTLKFVKEIAPAKKKHALSTTCLYPTK